MKRGRFVEHGKADAGSFWEQARRLHHLSGINLQ